MLVPVFSYGIYPFVGRFVAVTPLRKIAAGLFVCASSFVLIAWIESRIHAGHVVSIWWQILAYAILTPSEVLVSITAQYFTSKQDPLPLTHCIRAQDGNGPAREK